MQKADIVHICKNMSILSVPVKEIGYIVGTVYEFRLLCKYGPSLV